MKSRAIAVISLLCWGLTAVAAESFHLQHPIHGADTLVVLDAKSHDAPENSRIVIFAKAQEYDFTAIKEFVGSYVGDELTVGSNEFVFNRKSMELRTGNSLWKTKAERNPDRISLATDKGTIYQINNYIVLNEGANAIVVVPEPQQGIQSDKQVYSLIFGKEHKGYIEPKYVAQATSDAEGRFIRVDRSTWLDSRLFKFHARGGTVHGARIYWDDADPITKSLSDSAIEFWTRLARTPIFTSDAGVARSPCGTYLMPR